MKISEPTRDVQRKEEEGGGRERPVRNTTILTKKIKFSKEKVVCRRSVGRAWEMCFQWLTKSTINVS